LRSKSGLVKTEFNLSGNSDHPDSQLATREDKRVSQQPAGTTHEVHNILADPERVRHERLIRDIDIKIYDREKLASLASSSAQMRQSAIVAGAVSLAALGIAGLGAWNSNYFLRPVPSLLPINQKDVSPASDRPISTLPLNSVEAPQQAKPSASTQRALEDFKASEPRDVTKNGAPRIGVTKIATIVPQNVASVPPSAAVHRRPKPLPMPFLETKPNTINGWVLREVANGTAVLQGPNGVWKAIRGDTVPGLGKVDSIVMWGGRWIIATTRGLVTTQ
jgi:hypothetical protein